MTLGELKNRIRFLDDGLEVVITKEDGTELNVKDVTYVVCCSRGGNKGKLFIKS